ncbi:GNAT family N-acetyltransferase [Aspergillus undulatus]|uniref:GNAT family N-acetyltransferase n=1 Tax=Aspergillus undulatus TaxID=1810928 RepID=UPI003CCE3C5A
MPPSIPSLRSKPYKTTLLPPPATNNGHALALPTRTIPHPSTNPSTFNDAMAVRLEVFVDEQKCPAEFEIDEDDARSWHWVIYDPEATAPNSNPGADGEMKSLNLPVGVVRLVPPPHASHESFIAAYAPNPDGTDTGARGISAEGYDFAHEPYIKLGRVAVLKDYRGAGVARRVMEEALEWAESNKGDINKGLLDVAKKEGKGAQEVGEWKGLTLVHAQVDVERFYQGLGFVTDEGLGRWVEEGIEHVGMWKRLDV